MQWYHPYVVSDLVQRRTDVIKTRGSCLTCVMDAPSQPAGCPVAPPVPSFPFQYVVGIWTVWDTTGRRCSMPTLVGLV